MIQLSVLSSKFMLSLLDGYDKLKASQIDQNRFSSADMCDELLDSLHMSVYSSI